MIARFLYWLRQDQDERDSAWTRSAAGAIAAERIKAERLERPAPDHALVARIRQHVVDRRFHRNLFTGRRTA